MRLRGTQHINDSGHLEIGGCDTVALARRFGTPLYVVDEEHVRNNCRRYVAALAQHYEPETHIAYAGKAFLVSAMCKIVEQEGLWLDVASAGELHTAINAKFPADRLSMHGNYKSEAELQMALDHSIHRIVVDSLTELEQLEQIAARNDAKADILLRVTPGVEAHTHEYIQTGQIDTKFGIHIEGGLALHATKLALKLPHLNLHGFHCHIGSQVFELESFSIAAKLMFNFLNVVRQATDRTFAEVNLGGGLGIRYAEDENPPSVEEFAISIGNSLRVIAEKWDYPSPTLILEPGRSIIGEAGTTLYTVGVVKEVPNVRNFVSIDGGMSDNPRPALYDARYEALVANKAKAPANYLCTVAGKHCETDTLIRDVRIAGPEVDDILAVFSTGAYNHSMASNYNRLTRPAVVLAVDGNADIISQREELDDLLRLDVMPERLTT